MLKLILTAIHEPLLEAWLNSCGDLDFVEVREGSIFTLSVDAVVSPANSFGFMDGGIDRLYTAHYGPDVQGRLQDIIRRDHGGELLVGHADLVPIPGDQHARYLISAPTMRIPRILGAETVNPYLAARAVFRLFNEGRFRYGDLKGKPYRDHIESIAFPGLGTGVGRVPPEICAAQVRAAIEEELLGQKSFPKTWWEAAQKHQTMYTDEIRDLQHDD